ncbi:hypothetical protein AURDEDRAFT_114104, partial [Auricularia subglabra TFB-10046 SS5]
MVSRTYIVLILAFARAAIGSPFGSSGAQEDSGCEPPFKRENVGISQATKGKSSTTQRGASMVPRCS